jgi:hypothetical protein
MKSKSRFNQKPPQATSASNVGIAWICIGLATLSGVYLFSDSSPKNDIDLSEFVEVSSLEGIWKPSSEKTNCDDARTHKFTFESSVKAWSAKEGETIIGSNARYYKGGDKVNIEFDLVRTKDGGINHIRWLHKVNSSAMELVGIWHNGHGGLVLEAALSDLKFLQGHKLLSFDRCD